MKEAQNFERLKPALKRAFTVHFIIDILMAVPLMMVPGLFLSLIGWQTVDPVSARLTGAALFGIGIESFLGRNSGIEAYRGMLNLKIIWSVTAILGIGLSLIEGAHGRPLFLWLFGAVFVAFNLLWFYFRLNIDKTE